jgi:hypothetical protein
MNFGAVEEGLYRGAIPTEINVPFLETLNLRTVVLLEHVVGTEEIDLSFHPKKPRKKHEREKPNETPRCLLASWLEIEQENGKENIGRGEGGWAETPFTFLCLRLIFFLGSLRLLWGFSGLSLLFLWQI